MILPQCDHSYSYSAILLLVSIAPGWAVVLTHSACCGVVAVHLRAAVPSLNMFSVPSVADDLLPPVPLPAGAYSSTIHFLLSINAVRYCTVRRLAFTGLLFRHDRRATVAT